jgi:hypothetical protein
MIPNNKTERRKMIARMIESIEYRSDDLGDWEQNFMESIAEQFKDKNDLTDRQCEILERIHDRYC